ncbi:tRNA adenosine(34) deaminase TadA [bacterium]|nr:tRNA adenosine(34) deaminase TadA [bacterium]
MIDHTDEQFMAQALAEAEKAKQIGEIPIGCVIVKDGEIIGRGHNLRESTNDPTAHAEIIAMRQASKKISNWRLEGCEVYVTLEPCPMCAAALIMAGVRRIVFGAPNRELGACGTVWDFPNDPGFDNHPLVKSGVLRERCEKILVDFMKSLRQQ